MKRDATAYALHAAFDRAALEQRELQRLKASGKPWAALDFNPERLGRDEAATRTTNDATPEARE